MTLISEDPWPIAGALVVVAVVGLLMVRFTQRGKYLGWALGALGLAAVLVLVERFWVTDRERIEATLYAIADAVERSDADALESYLAPEFDEEIGTISRAYMRGRLKAAEFEFLILSNMDISRPGRQTRQATAEVSARASWKERTSTGGPDYNATPKPTRWSLGLREVEPKVWKVTRIELIDTGVGGVSAGEALRGMPG